MYTQQDVFNTAFKYVPIGQSPLGLGLPHGINQVCVCCKAGSIAEGHVVGHVRQLINPVDLRPWAEFYKTMDYAAYECQNCGYTWSWYRPQPGKTSSLDKKTSQFSGK